MNHSRLSPEDPRDAWSCCPAQALSEVVTWPAADTMAVEPKNTLKNTNTAADRARAALDVDLLCLRVEEGCGVVPALDLVCGT